MKKILKGERFERSAFGIDKVLLYLPHVRTEAIKAFSKLEKREVMIDHQTGEEIRQFGRLKNLRVSAGISTIRIEGSPSTFLFGENASLASMLDMITFQDRLSEFFGVDFGEAQIWGIDATANVPTLLSPNSYFGCLTAPSRYSLDESQENTRYVQTQRRSRVFACYDKSKELMDAGLTDEGWNLLRFECRIPSRLKAKFKKRKSKECVTLKELHDEDIWMELFEIFTDTATSSVLRHREPTIEIDSVRALNNYALDDLLRNSEKRRTALEYVNKTAKERRKCGKPISSAILASLRKILSSFPVKLAQQYFEVEGELIELGTDPGIEEMWSAIEHLKAVVCGQILEARSVLGKRRSAEGKVEVLS